MPGDESRGRAPSEASGRALHKRLTKIPLGRLRPDEHGRTGLCPWCRKRHDPPQPHHHHTNGADAKFEQPAEPWAEMAAQNRPSAALRPSDPMKTAAPAYAHGAGNATTLLSPTTTTQTEQMQSLSSRRSRGSKWWPKNDLLATLRPSDPMKTAVPSHAHDSVNAATIVLATTAMPTEHQEGTRTRRSRGSKSWPEIDLLAAFRL